MKMRNIILSLIAVFAGSLASCDTDLPSEPIIEDGENVSVSFILSTGGVETKAAGDNYLSDGTIYTSATPEELQINQVYIAVFDTDNKLVDFLDKSFDSHPEAEEGKSPDSNNITREYTVTGNNLKPGTYQFLAIANSALPFKDTEGAALYTEYADYEDLIERNLSGGQNTAVFNPSNLVKVSELQTKGISASGTNSIRIPLVQLAAKFELSFTVKGEEEKAGEPYYETKHPDISDKTWNDIMDFFNSNANKVPDNLKSYVEEYKWDGNTIFTFEDILLEPHSSGVKLFKVKGLVRQRREPLYSWRLNVGELIIDNIETQTRLVLDNINEEMVLKSITLSDSDLSGVFTFYSYEKNVDTDNPIKITVNGDLELVTKELITEYHGDWYTTWIKKGTRPTSQSERDYLIAKLEFKNNTYILDPGNGNSGFLLFMSDGNVVINNDIDPYWDDEIVEEKPISLVGTINPKYNPSNNCYTDGVIHGNIYTVGATIDVKSLIQVEMVLQWAVVPWSTHTIDVPAFN